MCRAFKQSNIVPGGFSERLAVSADHLANTVFPLPDTVSDKAASGIEPLACCLRAVDRLPEGVGNDVLVIGLGFIGLLTSQYLKYQGYYTYGLDLKPERTALATQHGMLDEAETDAETMLDSLLTRTDGRGADIVFLTVVTPQTVALALKAVRDGGVLLMFTSYGKGEPILSQNELYFREISVITSYSPSLYHLHQSYELITQERIQIEPLISHTVPLADLPRAMDLYRCGEAIKVLVTL
jgi:L-iditol 2-dehydrogenase